MSYSQLGISCTPQTIACTSNHKFLPLHACIYKRRSTYMLEYPGIDTNTPMSNVNTSTHSGNINTNDNNALVEIPTKINSSV